MNDGSSGASADAEALQEEIAAHSASVRRVLEAMQAVIVGQHAMLERLLLGLLANGHVLLEGVPGLAKTLAVTTLAQTLRVDFQRIQFTPDLLPADLVGTLIFEPKTGEFRVRKGPVFTNIVLADEINRAPAKVQSALLEAMQEGQSTIGEESFELPRPFLVLATQNPLEQDGTYPLPEAQVDRFMFKLRVDYPSRDEELRILRRVAFTREMEGACAVMSPDEIFTARGLIDQVHLDERLESYIVDIVCATRDPTAFGLEFGNWLDYGASPRATIFLALAGKAHAYLQGRAFVLPEDLKLIAPDVLRHRVLISYEAQAQNVSAEDIIEQILGHVAAP